MPTPFAALEERANASVLAHLANVVATWQAAGGGATVDADAVMPTPVLERNEAGVLNAVEYLRVAQDAWPLCVDGDRVTARGVQYRVRGIDTEAEGGLKRIFLARE